MVDLDDVNGLLQPKLFYDSVKHGASGTTQACIAPGMSVRIPSRQELTGEKPLLLGERAGSRGNRRAHLSADRVAV